MTASDNADGLIDGTIFTITSDPTNGSAIIDAASGAWVYTPNEHYHGIDSFTVTITDDDNHAENQVISLVINAISNLLKCVPVMYTYFLCLLIYIPNDH